MSANSVLAALRRSELGHEIPTAPRASQDAHDQCPSARHGPLHRRARVQRRWLGPATDETNSTPSGTAVTRVHATVQSGAAPRNVLDLSCCTRWCAAAQRRRATCARPAARLLKMCPSARRIGCKPEGRPEVAAITGGCAGACLSMLRGSHRASSVGRRGASLAPPAGIMQSCSQ